MYRRQDPSAYMTASEFLYGDFLLWLQPGSPFLKPWTLWAMNHSAQHYPHPYHPPEKDLNSALFGSYLRVGGCMARGTWRFMGLSNLQWAYSLIALLSISLTGLIEFTSVATRVKSNLQVATTSHEPPSRPLSYNHLKPTL